MIYMMKKNTLLECPIIAFIVIIITIINTYNIFIKNMLINTSAVNCLRIKMIYNNTTILCDKE